VVEAPRIAGFADKPLKEHFCSFVNRAVGPGPDPLARLGRQGLDKGTYEFL
jgi:hypothetical protein